MLDITTGPFGAGWGRLPQVDLPFGGPNVGKSANPLGPFGAYAKCWYRYLKDTYATIAFIPTLPSCLWRYLHYFPLPSPFNYITLLTTPTTCRSPPSWAEDG